MVLFSSKQRGRAFENANARPFTEHVPVVADSTASFPEPEPQEPLALSRGPSQAPEQARPEQVPPEQQARPRVPASSPLPSVGNRQRRT